MSIQDFSVAIGIESGHASNVEKVLKSLEKIKALDKAMKGSKLASDLANFDLRALSKDAGFDDIKDQLNSANESLRSMLEKTETMDEVFKSGGIMTSKMDALKQEVVDALNVANSDMRDNVSSVKNNVGRLKDKLRGIEEAVESIATNGASTKDVDALKAMIKPLETQWEGAFKIIDETIPIHTTTVTREVRDGNSGVKAEISKEVASMLKVIRDMIGGMASGKDMGDLTKKIQDVLDSIRTVKHLVTNSLMKSMPGTSMPPPAGGQPPPGVPPSPAAILGMKPLAPFPGAPPVPSVPSPTVSFNNLGRPYVGTGTQKRVLTLDEAQKMHERNVPVGGGKTQDDLKAWIERELAGMKKDIIAEVKKEKEKEPAGESVLGEGDVR